VTPAIPQSTKPARIAENFDIFDAELTPNELAAIDALDQGVRRGPDQADITLETFQRNMPEA
jgi:diketogulonate reductase-like aldo/keto reductase